MGMAALGIMHYPFSSRFCKCSELELLDRLHLWEEGGRGEAWKSARNSMGG